MALQEHVEHQTKRRQLKQDRASKKQEGQETGNHKERKKKRKKALDLKSVNPRWQAKMQHGPKRIQQQQQCRGSSGNYDIISCTAAQKNTTDNIIK